MGFRSDVLDSILQQTRAWPVAAHFYFGPQELTRVTQGARCTARESKGYLVRIKG